MPILDMQVRLRELGRIRTGDKAQNGAPRKLETFRLTSPSQTLIEAATVAFLIGVLIGYTMASP